MQDCNSADPSACTSCTSQIDTDLMRDYATLFDSIQNKLHIAPKMKCEGITSADNQFPLYPNNFYIPKDRKRGRIKPTHANRAVIRDPLLPKEDPNCNKRRSCRLVEKKPDIEEYGAIRGHGFKYFNTMFAKKRQCDKASEEDDSIYKKCKPIIRSSSQCRSSDNLDNTTCKRDYTTCERDCTNLNNCRKKQKFKKELPCCSDEPPPTTCCLRNYFKFYKRKRKCPPPKVTWTYSETMGDFSDAALKKVTPSKTACQKILSKTPTAGCANIGCDHCALHKSKTCVRKVSCDSCKDNSARYNTARCKTEKPTSNVICYEGIPITQSPRRKDRYDTGVHGYTYYRRNGTVRPPGKVPSCGIIKKGASRKYSNPDLGSQSSKYSNTAAPPCRRSYEELKEQVLYCGGCPPKGSWTTDSCSRQFSRYNTCASRRHMKLEQLPEEYTFEPKERCPRGRRRATSCRRTSSGSSGKAQSCTISPSCRSLRRSRSFFRSPSFSRPQSCGRSPSCTKTPSRGIIKYDSRCKRTMRNQCIRIPEECNSTCVPINKTTSQKLERTRNIKCFDLRKEKSHCSLRRSCVKFLDETPQHQNCKKKVQSRVLSTTKKSDNAEGNKNKNKNHKSTKKSSQDVSVILDKCGQDLKELRAIMQKMLKASNSRINNKLNAETCSSSQCNDIKPITSKCCPCRDEKSAEALRCRCTCKKSLACKGCRYREDESLSNKCCRRKKEMSGANKCCQQKNKNIDSLGRLCSQYNDKKPIISNNYYQKEQKPYNIRESGQLKYKITPNINSERPYWSELCESSSSTLSDYEKYCNKNTQNEKC